MPNEIAPQTGTAFTMKKGQRLKVIDPQGKQVSDMLAFNQEDIREYLSSGKTLDYESKLFLTEGNFLWSNRSQKMLKIIKDTNGRNDFLLAPCSKETFEIIYDNHEAHPSCFHNFEINLAKYGIEPDQIPTAFNLFMNVTVAADGTLKVEPPTSKAGDYVILEAMMDLIVSLTACSAEQSNDYSFKPIHWEILEAESTS